MGYRHVECEPWTDCRTVCDVGSSVDFHILNGVVSEFIIPCTYVVHEEDGTITEVPIHLAQEGYSDPVFLMDPHPEGVTAYVEISPDDDSIIKLLIDADCPDAVKEPFVCNMVLHISRTDDSTPLFPGRTDAVLRGQLLIAPAPIAQTSEVML